MSARKSSSAVADRRPSQALEVYEKAVRALGKRDYERAKEHLDALIGSYPEERDLLERARAYRALCERALEKRPAFRPKTFEDLLNYGVFLHNRGEFEEALKYLHQAAEIHPRNEHVLYCIAAASARAGDRAAALKALRGAIAANPSNRAQARSDADFDPIRDDEEFFALVSQPQV
jgi:tetratricopeptide (TPR) repeat protein